jgi:hypothetical protein
MSCSIWLIGLNESPTPPPPISREDSPCTISLYYISVSPTRDLPG